MPNVAQIIRPLAEDDPHFIVKNNGRMREAGAEGGVPDEGPTASIGRGPNGVGRRGIDAPKDPHLVVVNQGRKEFQKERRGVGRLGPVDAVGGIPGIGYDAGWAVPVDYPHFIVKDHGGVFIPRPEGRIRGGLGPVHAVGGIPNVAHRRITAADDPYLIVEDQGSMGIAGAERGAGGDLGPVNTVRGGPDIVQSGDRTSGGKAFPPNHPHLVIENNGTMKESRPESRAVGRLGPIRAVWGGPDIAIAREGPADDPHFVVVHDRALRIPRPIGSIRSGFDPAESGDARGHGDGDRGTEGDGGAQGDVGVKVMVGVRVTVDVSIGAGKGDTV